MGRTSPWSAMMPREFSWQFWSGPRQLWVPVGYNKTDFGRGNNSFIALARLKPGVSVAQAAAEMAAVGSNVAKQYPREDADMGATVYLLETPVDFLMPGNLCIFIQLHVETLPKGIGRCGAVFRW